MKNGCIGNFIKDLRKEKNWTQEDLAQELFVDRTTVNKWENGKSEPDKSIYLMLCKVFDVSLMELVSGERETQENKKLLQSIFVDYLKNQDTKYKKMKFLTIFLVLIILFLFSTFTIYYFFQNYRSIKVYNFEGASSSYQITNGFLLLSKQRIFFNLGKISPDVQEISIYYEYDSNKKLIYQGEASNTIIDSYGYNSFLSYENFDKIRNSFYVQVKDEIIKLNFTENYINDSLFFTKAPIIGDPSESLDNAIPEKIKKYFSCEKDNCSLIKDKIKMVYNIPTQTFTVLDDSKFYQYSSDFFSYIESNKEAVSFEMLNQNIECKSGDCRNAMEIYNTFYHDYILLYLE